MIAYHNDIVLYNRSSELCACATLVCVVHVIGYLRESRVTESRDFIIHTRDTKYDVILLAL